jgi:hypothetical protein
MTFYLVQNWAHALQPTRRRRSVEKIDQLPEKNPRLLLEAKFYAKRRMAEN